MLASATHETQAFETLSPLTPAQESHYLQAYLPLVRKVVKQLAAQCSCVMEREDMQQVALIGLLDALRRYGKPDEGFGGYAVQRIRGAVLDNPGAPLFIYDANSPDGPLAVNPDITADQLAFSSDPDASGNGDNLQALINIANEPLTIANLGTVTVGSACTSIISNIGIYSRQNQTEAESAGSVYSEAQNQRSSVSGVSMDEEAVNLITYTQIYQANLKVISTGAEIFDSVLEMF